MARTWFGEIGPCCCLPPLLNLPAAFSQPRAKHLRVPSISVKDTNAPFQAMFMNSGRHVL